MCRYEYINKNNWRFKFGPTWYSGTQGYIAGVVDNDVERSIRPFISTIDGSDFYALALDPSRSCRDERPDLPLDTATKHPLLAASPNPTGDPGLNGVSRRTIWK